MRKALWLLSSGLVTLAFPAFAQDAGPAVPDTAAEAPAMNEGDIIVTATRRASPLSTVPIAVTALTADTLRNTGANDLRQLNQVSPSLLVSSTGTEANGSARIRGIGTVGDNPGLESSVAVFIDGVYRSRTGVGLNELGEIERVEVLRGPQGTLFGRNASAGLINVVSKKPSFEEGGTAEASYGNYDNIRAALGLTGPIIADKLAYRIDGVYNKRDGFYKDVVSGKRHNNRNRYFIRGQLLFEPSSDLSLRLIGDYTRRREDCCAAVYVSTRQAVDPTPGVPGDAAISPANPIVDILHSLGGVLPSDGDPFNRLTATTPGRTFRNKTVDWGGSGELNWQFGGVKLTSITAYRYYKSGGAADIDYGNVDIGYRADDGNAYRRFKTFSQEVRLQGSLFNDRLDWLVGGYFAHEKLQLSDNLKFGSQYGAFAACRVVSNINPAAALRDPTAPGCLSAIGTGALNGALGAAAPLIIDGLNRLSQLNDLGDNRALYKQDSTNYAIFTHNIINITDRVSLTLGARYTHERKKFQASFDNDNTLCPAQQAALGPLLSNAQLATLAGGIITLTCTGNSSSTLNALDLRSRRSEGEWTGTAVLSWKPVSGLLTYASYSRGYKSGGFNLDRSPLGGPTGVFSPRTNADADGLQFEPEKVNAYEVGFKYNSRRFNLNVAAFREEFRNFQLNTFNGTVFVVQTVDSCSVDLNGADTDQSIATGACPGKTKAGVVSQGVEVEAALYPVRNVAVSAGYTYARTKYRHNLVGSSAGAALDPSLFLLAGSQVSNAPRNVVTVSGSWTPDIGSTGLSGLLYVDARTTSAYNTGSDLFPEKAQESYTLVNARIGIRGPDARWSLEFWGQNIFNVHYQQVAFNTPFQGSGTIAQVYKFGGVANQIFSSYLAEPRTYGVTVRTKF